MIIKFLGSVLIQTRSAEGISQTSSQSVYISRCRCCKTESLLSKQCVNKAISCHYRLASDTIRCDVVCSTKT